MRDAPDRRIVMREQRLELPGCELFRCLSVIVLVDQAMFANPPPRSRERGPHEPAAAFTRAASERYHRCVGKQITGDVILRRNGQERRSLELALIRHSVRRLTDRVVASALAPRPFVPPRAERPIHHAGTDSTQSLRRTPAARKRSWPIR